jgi:hypothetical protein
VGEALTGFDGVFELSVPGFKIKLEFRFEILEGRMVVVLDFGACRRRREATGGGW